MRPRIRLVVAAAAIKPGDHVTDQRAVLAVRECADGKVNIVLKRAGWRTPRTAAVVADARITVWRPDSYIRARFTNRHTHAEIEVLDTYDPASEFNDQHDDWRWYSVCRTHAMVCSHETLSLAMGHAAEPDGWCEACRDLIHSAEAKGA